MLKKATESMLLRGECTDVKIWKRHLSEAQVMWFEFNDIVCDLREVLSDDKELSKLASLHDQVESDWRDTENAINSEIADLTQSDQKTETASFSGKSRRSGRSRASSVYSASKLELKEREAVLKTKFAFAEEEKRLKLLKVEQEQRLEQLKIERDLAESQAKLKVYLQNEEEEFELDLDMLPAANKQEDLEKFLESQQPEAPIPLQVSELPLPDETPTITPQLATQQAKTESGNGWDQVAFSLETCMETLVESNAKLVEVSLQQGRAS